MPTREEGFAKPAIGRKFPDDLWIEINRCVAAGIAAGCYCEIAVLSRTKLGTEQAANLLHELSNRIYNQNQGEHVCL